MSKKKRDDFIDMYEELTDPLKLAEARRRNEVESRLKSKKEDTGL